MSTDLNGDENYQTDKYYAGNNNADDPPVRLAFTKVCGNSFITVYYHSNRIFRTGYIAAPFVEFKSPGRQGLQSYFCTAIV